MSLVSRNDENMYIQKLHQLTRFTSQFLVLWLFDNKPKQKPPQDFERETSAMRNIYIYKWRDFDGDNNRTVWVCVCVCVCVVFKSYAFVVIVHFMQMTLTISKPVASLVSIGSHIFFPGYLTNLKLHYDECMQMTFKFQVWLVSVSKICEHCQIFPSNIPFHHSYQRMAFS